MAIVRYRQSRDYAGVLVIPKDILLAVMQSVWQRDRDSMVAQGIKVPPENLIWNDPASAPQTTPAKPAFGEPLTSIKQVKLWLSRQDADVIEMDFHKLQTEYVKRVPSIEDEAELWRQGKPWNHRMTGDTLDFRDIEWVVGYILKNLVQLTASADMNTKVQCDYCACDVTDSIRMEEWAEGEGTNCETSGVMWLCPSGHTLFRSILGISVG